jgi:hypothetical protein
MFGGLGDLSVTNQTTYFNSTIIITLNVTKCHNLSLRLVTKAKACKGVGQEGSPKVTYHAPGSVGEYEGMNPNTPK